MPQPSPLDTSANLIVRYLGYTFISLIESFDRIENDLCEEAEEITTRTLAAIPGFELAGTVLRFRDTIYRCIARIDAPTRHLLIDVLDAQVPHGQIYCEYSMQEFGLVKGIRIALDNRLARLNDSIADVLVAYYRAAYLSLENSYVAAYQRWIKDLFSDMYTVVNTDLEINHLSQLKDRFWFSVTDLDEETFRYHFSVQTLRTAIAWLKHYQNPVISPCDSISMLITNEAPDAINAPSPYGSPVAYSALTKTIPFQSLPTLTSSMGFWLAEHALFATDGLAATKIATIQGQSFEINYPADFTQAMDGRITEIAPLLEELMRKRYAEFKHDQKQLRTAVRNIGRRITAPLRDVGVDFTAKVVAELIRPPGY